MKYCLIFIISLFLVFSCGKNLNDVTFKDLKADQDLKTKVYESLGENERRIADFFLSYYNENDTILNNKVFVYFNEQSKIELQRKKDSMQQNKK